MIDDAAWDPVRQRLEHELAALRTGDALVLAEPAPPPDAPPLPARRGIFGRRRTPAPSARYVQVLRHDDAYLVECVGPSFWALSDGQERALAALGYAPPGAGAGLDSPNFSQHVSDRETARVADLAVESLDLLGCDPRTPWVWDRIAD